MVCLTCYTIWKDSMMIFEMKYRTMFVVWFVLFNATFWTIDFNIPENLEQNICLLSLNMGVSGIFVGVSGFYLYLIHKGLIDVWILCDCILCVTSYSSRYYNWLEFDGQVGVQLGHWGSSLQQKELVSWWITPCLWPDGIFWLFCLWRF